MLTCLLRLRKMLHPFNILQRFLKIGWKQVFAIIIKDFKETIQVCLLNLYCTFVLTENGVIYSDLEYNIILCLSNKVCSVVL